MSLLSVYLFQDEHYHINPHVSSLGLRSNYNLSTPSFLPREQRSMIINAGIEYEANKFS